MNVGATIDRVLTVLQDGPAIMWPRDEILTYVNDGQADVARRTLLFRRIARLDTGQDPHLFALPEDVVQVLWAEYDGERLLASSFRELENLDASFTSTTGTPQYWYQDLANLDQIRLYPIPDDNEEDTAEFSQEEGFVVSVTIIGAEVEDMTPSDAGLVRQIVSASTTTVTGEDVSTALQSGTIIGQFASVPDPGTVSIVVVDEDGTDTYSDDGSGVLSCVGGGAGTINYTQRWFELTTTTSGAAITVNATSADATYETITENSDYEFYIMQQGMLAEGEAGTGSPASENGSIIQVLASRVRIGYAYRPDSYSSDSEEIVLSGQNEQLLVWYACFRAYQKMGDEESLKKSAYYKALYDEQSQETARRIADGFSRQARKVRGRWL